MPHGTRSLPLRVWALRLTGLRSVLAAQLLFVAGLPAGAQTIDRFPTPNWAEVPKCIVGGPDGNVWYTTGTGLVGRVTPEGGITEFTVLSGSDLDGITVGSDGNLWVAQPISRIVRITPAGVVTSFAVPQPDGQPHDVATGADGNVWFTESAGNRIGRITPAGEIVRFPVVFPQYRPLRIAAGADGNLWFTLWEAFVPGGLGRIGLSGDITYFPLTPGAVPWDVTPGADGNIWFTEWGTSRLGRITPSGSVSEFDLPLSFGHPGFLTSGPDGNLWVTGLTRIAVMTVEGVLVREILLPPNQNEPQGITSGPDGNVWFTLPSALGPDGSPRGEICRVNLRAMDAAAVPGPAPIGLAVLAILLSLSALPILRRTKRGSALS